MPLKQKRLPRALWDSLRGIQGSQSAFSQYGTLKYYPYKTTHFSVVVSSKHEKRAVKRNILKRHIYSLFTQKNPISGIYIFFPSKQAYTLSYEALSECIKNLFTKVPK